MSDSHQLFARILDGKPTVLLVDDDANILDTAKDILEDAHYVVSTASNGAKALALLEGDSFNVVVVDFQLPDSTGLELARKIRERHDHTYVILMTGHASLEMAVKAIQEAVYDYLIKPVNPGQLQRTIERAVEKQRLVLENKQLVQDLRQANEAMARLDRLKSRMLTVLSHDLKTPLSSIRGYSELLKSGAKGKITDGQKRMVEITIQEADHLNGLIGDLLDLANIEAGRLSLDTREMPFNELIQKTLPRVRLIAEMKEIPLEVTLPAPLPEVLVDVPRMVQVMSNLLRAALKQTSRGGRVYLTALEKDNEVELKISYPGQGFTADQLKTIFDWMNSPTGQPQGSQDGLRIGLAIAREILHAHKGEIGVESHGVDQGATFWLRLPVSVMATKE
jgi:signal transduction histidine kinase